jgi:hypothetical protein
VAIYVKGEHSMTERLLLYSGDIVWTLPCNNIITNATFGVVRPSTDQSTESTTPDLPSSSMPR